MTKRILIGASFILPLLANADTLTMRNGATFRGTFNNANATQISFTEYNGNRQTVNVNDVQELRFGNDRDSNGPNQSPNRGPAQNDAGFGRDSSRNPATPPYPTPGQPRANYLPAQDLDRLQSDLQTAMSNNSIPDGQRQSLQDSSDVLRNASEQARSGRPMDQRAVRLALDGIRNAANSFGQRDRDTLLEDVRRVGAAVSGPSPNGGRDY